MQTCIASKNVLVYENNSHTISPALIEINGTHICSVQKIPFGQYDSFLNSFSKKNKTTVHNYGNHFISPAFVNCHTHVAMNFFKAVLNTRLSKKNMMEDLFFHLESSLTREDVLAFSRIGAYENLLSGVGLIWDHYYHGTSVAKACKDVGLSAVVAPTLQDIIGPGVPMWQQALQETESICSDSAFSDHGIFAALGPHATDTVSPNLFEHCLRLGKKWKIPIHCHAAQSFEETQRIQKNHKKTPIAFLASIGILDHPHGVLLAHGIHTKSSDFKLLKKGKNALVFCPFSQMIFQFPANILEWEKQKCTWFVATDCVASNDSMNLQKELRLVSGFPSLQNTFAKNKKYDAKTKKQQSAFAREDFLLHKVFQGPGQFHPQFTAGVIQPKALANIVIWNTDHPSFWPSQNLLRNLAMGDTTGAIHNMWICGKQMGENGNFANSILNSHDYKNALIEAQKRLDGIIKRLL